MSRSVRARRPLRVENLEARDVPAVNGIVFRDADHDGIRETGDTGISGIIVEAFHDGTFHSRVTTGSDGSFSFTDLTTGTAYQLRVATAEPGLAGLTLSPADQGGDDAVDSDATISGPNAVVDLTAAATDQAFDFGFGSDTLTLGGTVFADPDDTGADTGDGIAGVTVELLPPDAETPLATTTTDSSGNYSFAGLQTGQYRVRIAASNFAADAVLDGFTPSTGSTADPDDDVDDDSNGAVSGTLGSGGFVITEVMSLTAGEEPENDGNTNNTVDFGMVGEDVTPTGASITGQVFLDYDNTGVFDGPDVEGPDSGLAGVTVRLSGGDLTAPVEVQTNSSGVFTFTGLAAGTYTLTEVQPTAPNNRTGQDVPGSAGGDSAVANVISDIVIAEDDEATDYLFAEIPFTSTGGTVFEDTNGNGELDTGEPGIPNVTVTLTGTSVVTEEEITPVVVTTNASGVYTFTNLDPGLYTITQTQPTGFTDGEEQNGTPEATIGDDEFADIDLTSVATSSGFNFGETTGSSGGTGGIAGFVYTDADNDGVKDTAETGVVGVTITLTGTDDQSQPVSRTTTTTADGSFSFTGLRAGTYALAETQPTGVTDGVETAGTAGGVTTTNDSITGIELEDGDIATGYLFGEAAGSSGGTGSIAGSVFADADDDGVRDTGETGIPGVTITLTGTDDQSQPVSMTATTGTDGSYSFTGLRAGTYAIAETQPATGFTDGDETAGTAGGTTTTNDSITGITLAAGATATGYLFAEVPTSTGGTGSLAGSVFADADNDGVRDTGETGINGVTITLTGTDDQSQPVSRTTTTGTDGSYSFTGLRAGTYAIAQTQPTGFTDGTETAGTAGGTLTAPNSITAITLAAGATATGYLFADVPASTGGTGSLSGRVFRDKNGNGVRNTGDAGIGGVTITLTGTDDQSQPVSRTTTTGTDGRYSFTGLRAGTYAIAETQPATGFTDGDETAGTAGGTTTTNDSITGITLTAGKKASGYLFAEVPEATTESPPDLRVRVEADDSSVQPGDTVTLTYTVRNRGDETATGVEVLARLGGLEFVSSDGDYDPDTRIWTVGDVDGDGTATLEITATVPSSGTFSPAARVSAEDETITPRNGSTTITAGTPTAPAGRFWFLSSGYTNRGSAPSTPNNPPAPTRSTLSGQVFADADDDGVKDTGEAGVGGVTVTLTGTDNRGESVNKTATTNANGNYTFTGLRPGDYSVNGTPVTGFTDGTAIPGSAGGTASGTDEISDITLTSGETATGYLFAFTPTTGTGTASIAGSVFSDADDDGIRDTGETGVSNVTVTLTGTDDQSQPVSRTATTGTDGSYSFTGLRAGTYTIAETQPATGFTDGDETPGTAGGTTTTNDSISGITLDAAEAATGYLFAEVPTSTGGTASIAGSVFGDADSDGVRDTGETGVSEVTITLTGTDDQSQPVSRTATTGTDGSYSFTGLRAGTYAIAETQPATGFTDGTETAGTAGGLTTTNDSITGITLDAAEAATGYLFAEVPTSTGGTGSIAGSVFADADDDGVQDTGETGISGVTITLTGTDDQSQAVSRTATTGTDGSYSFTGLRAGTYAIAETPPATGFTDGDETAGTAGGVTTTNDSITGITLTAGATATGYLFAEVPTSTGGTASIAGVVFGDADSDGVQDTGETGVSGVTITLTGTDDQSQPVSRTATTTTDGSYSFTALRPGTYAVAETPPATGFTDGAETAGTAGGVTTTNDSITGITITAGLAATGYLFAEIPTSTGNATPTVLAAPAAVSLTGTGTQTVDLAGTFDDADIVNTLIRFNTSKGAVNVELFDRQAPKTVANFLNYVTDGDYANSIFHRYAELGNGTPFVLQGGGFAFDADPTPSIVNIPTDPAVQNEFSVDRSPILGTLAMAKLGGDPNSATNQFFFNLADNSSILNPQNGGFTVFGRLVGAADQAVVDALAAIPTQDQSDATALPASIRGAFGEVPLENYTGTAFPTDTTAANYAMLTGVEVVSQPEALTYSIVTGPSAAVATATITKNRLTVTGVAAGTTTITVRATDKSGAFVDTTVNVTVS
jgi:cyclophilin family peptidyl-prolyl cis-trans isomerase/uncharacterized surface anchored protein